MQKIGIIILFFITLGQAATAQVEIAVNLQKNVPNNWLYVGEIYGDQQFMLDSFPFDATGTATIRRDSLFEQGLYLLTDKTGKLLEVLLPADQQFTLQFDSVRFCGSTDNELFRLYIDSATYYTNAIDKLNNELALAQPDDSAQIADNLTRLKTKANQFSNTILNKNSQSFFAHLIRAGQTVTLPDSLLQITDPDQALLHTYTYRQQHFFDNIDLTDKRLLRTTALHTQLTSFFEEHVWPVPDSLYSSAVRLTELFKPYPDYARYLTSYLLNFDQYTSHMAADKLMVEIYDYYTQNKLLNWIPGLQRMHLNQRMETLRPLLLGKIAPDLQLEDNQGIARSLYDYKGQRIVLFFWSIDCEHCLEEMPIIQQAYAKAQQHNWQFVGVYTGQERDNWRAMIQAQDLPWPNLYDSKGTSDLFRKYNVYMTPTFYLLGEDFSILLKNFSADQLGPIIDVFDEQ